MHPFGQTRSVRRSDYLLQTPDTFVRAPLPGMRGATAIVHAAPAIGAKFTQYTVEVESGGSISPTPDQRFLYVLEGSVTVAGVTLRTGDYAWSPPGFDAAIKASETARVTVIEKPYCPLQGIACPPFFTGQESSLAPTLLAGDPWLEVRSLIPAKPSFDIAVNTMTFQPGATLPMVEIHVMEHGLLMLDGNGIYRLGDNWHPVAPGDFIWMAPYLPQWFGALGKTTARYLIYKDWNR